MVCCEEAHSHLWIIYPWCADRAGLASRCICNDRRLPAGKALRTDAVPDVPSNASRSTSCVARSNSQWRPICRTGIVDIEIEAEVSNAVLGHYRNARTLRAG